jgi:hypothetical protein
MHLKRLAEDYYQNDYPEEEDSDEFEDRKYIIFAYSRSIFD